jgi:hypothetical protein
MSTQLSQANEPEENLADKLQDLEQHISQRISRLGEPDLQLLTGEMLEEPLSPVIPVVGGDYVPPFEPLEDYDYEASDPRAHKFGAMYRPPSANYEGMGEVMRAVHDLSDLLTESVLNLNIRLATIEEKLALVSQSQAHDLHKGVQEIKKVINAKGKAVPADDQSTATDLGATAELVRELQTQVKLLEEFINRSAVDVKQRIDERSTAVREHLDVRAKVLEKKSNDNKDYLNRHFFSLAILFIIIIFISSALITSSIDRLSGYLSEQSDSIRTQIDQLVFPHTQHKIHEP